MNVHFTVQEADAKKDLDTPGGEEMMKQLGGPSGLPYFAFLDADGAPIVNSLRPADAGGKGGNIGHPYEPYEVDWFMTMLGKAAPRMTAGERSAIEKWLRAQKK